MNIKEIRNIFYGSVLLCAFIPPLQAAPVWTKVTTGTEVENFFISSGMWASIGKDTNIPIAGKIYIDLPSNMLNRAFSSITNRLKDGTAVSPTDSHLSSSGELFAWNAFTVNLLNQDCGYRNEVGYFTYMEDDDGTLYLGECGVIFKVANSSKTVQSDPLGKGYRIVFKQRYGGYVRVGFFLRNKLQGSTQYTTYPLARTVFSVEAFNNIPGKKWFTTAGKACSTNSPPANRVEYTYIFEEDFGRSLFPESARPTIFGFEDNFYANSKDGSVSDWDFNDIVFVCGPVFREYETNRPPVNTITGVVWMDANQNGIMDGREYPVPNIKVELLDEMGGMVTSTSTSLGGIYRFEDLEEVGNFYIRVPTGDKWEISPVMPMANSDDDIVNKFDTETELSPMLILEGDTHLYHIDVGISFTLPTITGC